MNIQLALCKLKECKDKQNSLECVVVDCKYLFSHIKELTAAQKIEFKEILEKGQCDKDIIDCK